MGYVNPVPSRGISKELEDILPFTRKHDIGNLVRIKEIPRTYSNRFDSKHKYRPDGLLSAYSGCIAEIVKHRGMTSWGKDPYPYEIKIGEETFVVAARNIETIFSV